MRIALWEGVDQAQLKQLEVAMMARMMMMMMMMMMMRRRRRRRREWRRMEGACGNEWLPNITAHQTTNPSLSSQRMHLKHAANTL